MLLLLQHQGLRLTESLPRPLHSYLLCKRKMATAAGTDHSSRPIHYLLEVR